MQYKKSDVSDNYFGTVIPDPYRWLEDDNAPEVIAWVKEENKKTFKNMLTINPKDVIINESSKTTQWTLKIEQQVNSMSPLRTID